MGPFRAGLERQLARWRESRAAGMPRVGWKIGINVPEVQQRLGLPHAGMGWLDGARVYETGRVLELRPEAKLHVEVEAGIRLGAAVSAADSLSIARGKILTVHPALEIVDYAIPTSSLDDLLEHSMFHAGTVLGTGVPLASWQSLPADCPSLAVSGRSESPNRRDLVPQDLGEAVLFVARFLEELGMTLDEGDLVLSGSYLPTALPVSECGPIRGDFGELGSVEVEYVAAVAEGGDDGPRAGTLDASASKPT